MVSENTNKRSPLMECRLRLNWLDAVFLAIICVLSIWRRIWIIYWPNSTVFDEVHFGNFTNFYSQSKWFFDIHPPLGKLMMFMFANLSEYDGSIEFEEYYGRNMPSEAYVGLRFTPAWLSSVCAPMLYLTARFDGFTSLSSFTAAFMVVGDTSILAEHRYILSDGILHFWACFFLMFFSFTNTLTQGSPQWNSALVICGILLGAASSCKNTAWGLIAYTATIQLFQLCENFKFMSKPFITSGVNRALRLLIPVVTVYIGSFIVHFTLLPFDGPADVVTSGFKEELMDGFYDVWTKRIQGRNVITKTLDLAYQMHKLNMRVVAYHPSESHPKTWPFLGGRNVGFWTGSGRSAVACQGNVFVYYLADLSLVLTLFGWKSKNSKKWKNSMYYFMGWAVCYFPFFLVRRCMFLYHYIIPLMISCLSVCACMDMFLTPFLKGFVAVVVCILVQFGFILWSPYAYGSEPYAPKYTMWSANWLYGDREHKLMEQNLSSIMTPEIWEGFTPIP